MEKNERGASPASESESHVALNEIQNSPKQPHSGNIAEKRQRRRRKFERVQTREAPEVFFNGVVKRI